MAGVEELAVHLTALSDVALASLLAARPDLIAPPSPSLTSLAARAGARPSVERALTDLDAPALDVARAVLVTGSQDPAALAAALGADEEAVAVRLEQLTRLCLLTAAGPVGGLVEALRSGPAAAPAPGAEALPALSRGPDPAELDVQDAAAVADQCARAAEELVRLTSALLAEWGRESAPILRSGGVGARALVFVRSRRSAEIVAEHARRTLGRSQPELMSTVAAYRGGYLPEERRALERDLRSGRLRALATTSALELGIDVTGLDAVLIAGWPGTRVSLGQQAGRTGRAGTRGVAVLIASDNPLDAYLVHHPEDVFAAPEATVFDPANPYVLAPHLCAAASESPLRQADLELFGLPDDALLADLAERGALRRRPTGWFWNASLPGRPQDLTTLRGDGPPDVPIVESGSGTVIGTAPGASADSSLHAGAVYMHQGRAYVVDELTEEAAIVTPRLAVGYRTRARERSSVRILAERQAEPWADGVTWSLGSVEVTSQVTGYTKLALPSMEVVSQHPLDMPERVLPTAAVWWTLPPEACEAAGVAPAQLPGALHAAEHASIGILPLLATCDRWDIGGLSTALHPQTMRPTVFVHDGAAGGAGFVERGHRAGARWLQATLDVITECRCASGCPSCIQSPKCGNNNEPLDKPGAIALLRLLVQAARSARSAPPAPYPDTASGG